MQIDQGTIEKVVREVLNRMGTNHVPGPISGNGYRGRNGIFTDVNEAVSAARESFEELSRITLEGRKRIINHIRRISIEQCVELGTMEMEETKIGRLDHKIVKQKGIGETALGVEFLRSEVFSGDYGLAVIEHAPFGVIACITPVTHSLPTITCNAIAMIASGNTLVINPHPSGRRVAAEGVRRFNEAIYQDLGVDNLICLIAEPTIESANTMFQHPDINLISVTGGPGVARAAMMQAKRAIVAGPGNPPVVVDETADLDRAARSIIMGGGFDNNLLCIAEKEVFVVDSVFDKMMDAMERAGACRFNEREVAAFTDVAITTVGEGAEKHDVPSREFLGKDPVVLAQGIGRNISHEVELIFGETDYSNPFVPVEQMMPFVPFVRCRDVDQAIARAKESEHGFRHTALIHSTDVRNMTKMGRELDTSIFVKNGSCLAGLGVGGEGYGSYSIAGPTGEGITTPMTFTRERRCTIVESLRILGK